MSQTDIASQLEVSNVTAGRIIDRLEEHGWVERRPHPDDRRTRCLYLMPAVTPVLERLSDLGADEEHIALEGLSDSEQMMLDDLLTRIIENMAGSEEDVQGNALIRP